jgi:predicted nucleic acid-binding protein
MASFIHLASPAAVTRLRPFAGAGVSPFRLACSGDEWDHANQFLSLIAENAAKHYAHIRASLEGKGEPIGANDYLVAATVTAAKGILVTGNSREFNKVLGLKLENWLVE